METKEKIIALLEANDLPAMKQFIEENKLLLKRTLRARKGLPFWNALYHGLSLEIASLLIAEGIVDVQMTDSRGFTCLAHCKSLEIAQLFIDAGADIHHRNGKGQDITYYVVGQDDVQEVLRFYRTLLRRDLLPESILPDEKAFWEVVARAIKKGRGDERQIAIEAVRCLQEQPVSDIIRFELTYKQLCARCMTPDIWAVIFYLQGGCSDDDFLFKQRAWLISLGKAPFEEILHSPEVIKTYWKKNRKRSLNYSTIKCDSLGAVAATTYRRVTGKGDFVALMQRYAEPAIESHPFDVQRLHQLTDQGDKAFFYHTFPSFRSARLRKSR